MKSCYDCKNQSICFLKRELKNLVNHDILNIIDDEWYTRFFSMIKENCKHFEEEKVYECCSCGFKVPYTKCTLIKESWNCSRCNVANVMGTIQL